MWVCRVAVPSCVCARVRRERQERAPGGGVAASCTAGESVGHKQHAVFASAASAATSTVGRTFDHYCLTPPLHRLVGTHGRSCGRLTSASRQAQTLKPSDR